MGNHIPLWEQMADLALWEPGRPRGVAGRAAGYDQSHPAALERSRGQTKTREEVIRSQKGGPEGRVGWTMTSYSPTLFSKAVRLLWPPP